MDMQNVAKLDIPEGEVRTVHDKDGNLIWGKVSYSVKYKGDTAQNGTPAPSAPVAAQTVTGEQTISINGAAYTVDLGSIELCEIGTYQDYIYPSGGKWYVHKEVGKYVYNNDLTGNGTSSTLVAMLTPALPIAPNLPALDGVAVSNMYGTISADITKLGGTTAISCIRVNTSIDIADSYNAVKALAAANNLIIYYALATPTDTEITNAALVGQLEAVEQWLTRYGYNAAISGNLPIIIDRTAL